MKIIKIYLTGIIAFILALIFDKSIMQWSLNLRIDLINPVIKIIAHSGIVILFVVIMFFILIKKKRSLVLLTSAVGAYYIGVLLKFIIARPRPDIEQVVTAGFYSMPSTHAITLFALLPILYKEYPKYLWMWLLIIIIIVFSRFYIGVHYLSDLILGAMLGFLIGLLVLLLDKKYRFGII